MYPFAKTAILAIAVAATTLVPLHSASARDRWDDNRSYRHERNRDAAVLGVLGLAAGVAVGSALAQPRQPEGRVYIDPPVQEYRTYQEPRYTYDRSYNDDGYYPAPPRARTVYDSPVRAPAYRAPAYRTAEPWTRAWYDYCSQRYRSFNARTGTYTDYDGQRRFCNAG